MPFPSSGEYSLQINTRHQAIVRLHDALLIDGDFNGNDSDIKKGNIRLKTGMHPIRILIKKEENEDWNFKIVRSEEHTSELQSRGHLVCRLLHKKKKNKN